MAEFNELIRNFDKIRDYMRDFYIYGFKSRNDFKHKSARTYDNEKRRIESYVGKYMKWDYSKNGKTSFISMDCSKIGVNPLFAAWKSKTFTNNDIMLHFYILDILKVNQWLCLEELTDLICIKSGEIIEPQIVRIKCSEYNKNGIIVTEKKGKALFYSLSKQNFDYYETFSAGLIEAVKFFQGVLPFGEVGSFILDSESKTNDTFSFKHNYIAHTLEDGVLVEILKAIRDNVFIEFINYNEKCNWVNTFKGFPLKILTSYSTGRRYLCVYKVEAKRFFSYRLDHIKAVKMGEVFENANFYRELLEKNIQKVWGVGFGGRNRFDVVCVKIYINEKTEKYVIERIKREGQGGTLVKVEENIFLYTKEMFDSNDISPWIKTFMGRIIEFTGSNKSVVNRFYKDVAEMKKMYSL